MGVAKGQKPKDEYREEPQKVFLGIFLFIAVHSTIKPPLSTIMVENQRR
jgi:hypothetical protein